MRYIHRPLIILLVTFLISPGFAATYYVATNDPAADDGNPGTEELPFKTISHAASIVIPGDVVYVKAGIYEESVNMTTPGASGAPISFIAYGDSRPVIESDGLNSTGVILDSYYQFIGFEVRNWSSLGIDCPSIEGFIIERCLVHDSPYGISCNNGAHDFTIRDCTLYNFAGYGIDASSEGGDVCYDGRIIGCQAYNGQVGQNVDGFAFGDGDHFIIERCVSYNVYDGFDVKADYTTLRRCLAHSCRNSGFKLWGNNIRLENCIGYGSENSNVELDYMGITTTTELVNCTFVGGNSYNILVESAQNLRMYNCILSNGANIGLCYYSPLGNAPDSGLYVGDYNVFHNENASRAISWGFDPEYSLDDIENGKWSADSGQDVNSLITRDPAGELYLNLAMQDFHLFETSIAVDAATSQGAPGEDYDGLSRPQGHGFDIGAYEFNTGILTATPTITPIPTQTPTITPTPTETPIQQPRVMLAGYMSSRLGSTSGGIFEMLAMVDDINQVGISRAMLYLGDSYLGVDLSLADAQNWVFVFPAAELSAPINKQVLLLSIIALDNVAQRSPRWPYLNVK